MFVAAVAVVRVLAADFVAVVAAAAECDLICKWRGLADCIAVVAAAVVVAVVVAVAAGVPV